MQRFSDILLAVAVLVSVSIASYWYGYWYETQQQNIAYWQELSEREGAEVAYRVYRSKR